MAIEMDPASAVAAAEKIIAESDTRGYAWAPWIDLRYGVKNGLVIPILTHLSPIAPPPPIVPHAPEAGRADFQAILRRSRPDQK